MKRTQGGIVALTTLLAVTSFAAADADDDDPLKIYAFVGNIVNNFSAQSHKDYVNADEADDTNIDFMAGLEFDYMLYDSVQDSGHQRWNLFGEFIHSSRVLESSCEGSDSSDCQAQANPDDFLEIIRDSNVLEWLGGVKWSWYFGDSGSGEVPPHAFFVKLQGGFLRAQGAADDVIDNHFFGFGFERTTGKLQGSHVQFGIGRTDLFAEDVRSNRGKIGAVLNYLPNEKTRYAGFFFEGWLDSDFGPGSDDIQIDYGVFFDAGRIFQKLKG